MSEDKRQAPRATNSGTISFGMVSIPVKMYTSASADNVQFKQLGPNSKSPLKQKMWDPVDDAEVPRDQILKGFEVRKNEFVIFSADELKALEAVKSKSIDILEFVPADQTDEVYHEKSYYLGPDKGGDKAYALLSHAMRAKNVVAVGQWAARGKEELVMIAPYEDGLIMHQLYYATEVRSFENISGAVVKLSDVEQKLAGQLVEQLLNKKFNPGKYKDEYGDRVRGVAEKKAAGEEVVLTPATAKESIADVTQALMASLKAAQSEPEAKPAKQPTKSAKAAKARKRKSA